MRLSRRAVLRTLLALPIAATLDVERWLWIPGQLVTVPARPLHHALSLDELNAVTMRALMPSGVDTYFRADPLFKILASHHAQVFRGRGITIGGTT